VTPEQIKSLLDNVLAEVNNAADFAGVLDPGLIPFIAIGKAIDPLIPGLVASVAGWIAGNPPTEAEKSDFARKLAVLADKTAL